MSTTLVLAVGQHTDAGRVRDHNEDSLAAVPPEGTSAEVLERKGHLFLVADGMGGHAAGATASSIATQRVMQAYYEDDSDDLRASLERAFRLANAAIFDQSLSNLVYAGMGTTLVAAVCQDHRFLVANVGDSRAYLIRDGGIRQLTQDHSWVAEAVRQGTLSTEQARHHPRRNVITRSLGNRPDVEVDFFEEGLLPGDTLVLCSDGLSGLVYDEEIRDIVLAHASQPQAAAEQLVDLANERGGPDNITVVIVRAVQTPPVEAPAGGGVSRWAILGCLGTLVAAVALAVAAVGTLGGWLPVFLIAPPPSATTSPTAVWSTQTPGPATADTPTVTPGWPTPSGTGVPYPPPATVVPSATVSPTTVPPTTAVGPAYPEPAVTPTSETPITPTEVSSPTATLIATATPTATSTPTVTITATPTVTGTATVTPTLTATPTP